MKVFTLTLTSWMLLLIPTIPIALVGVTALTYGSIYGAACIVFALVIVLFNGSARLAVSTDEIRLSRYGRTVWTIPVEGTVMREGLAGDIRFIPAFIFVRQRQEVGYLLKGWFSPRAIDEVRQRLS